MKTKLKHFGILVFFIALVFLAVLIVRDQGRVLPPQTLEATSSRHLSFPFDNGSTIKSMRIASEVRSFSPDVQPFTLRGYVIDFRCAPVRGAIVKAMLGNEKLSLSELSGINSHSNYTATTSSDGQFVIEGFSPGDYLISAETEELGGMEKLNISGVSHNYEVIIVLSPMQKLEGRIVGDYGKPIEGAIVVVSQSTDAQPTRLRDFSLIQHTDNEGEFSFKLPINGYRLIARASGYSPTYTESLATGPKIHVIKLTRGFSISGNIVGADLSDTTVNYLNVDARPISGECTTSGDGKFRFDCLPEGTYVIQAKKGRFVSESEMVELGDDVQGINLFLEVGGAISGKVFEVGEVSKGLSNRVVYARPMAFAGMAKSSEPTTMTGVYNIEGLVPGKYSLEVASNDLSKYLIDTSERRHIVDVGIGEAISLDFGFDRLCFLRGVVEYPDSTEAPDANVVVKVLEPTGKKRTLNLRTTDNGCFEAFGIVGGSILTGFAHNLKWSSSAVGPIDVSPPGIEGLVIQLDTVKNASVSGVVTDDLLVPISIQIQAVSISDSEPQRLYTSIADRNGRFSIPNMYPGSYELIGQMKGDLKRVLLEVQLPEDRHVDGLELLYKPEATSLARGIVIDPDGQAIVGAELTVLSTDGATSQAGFTRAAVSDSQGMFNFRVAPDENAYVLVSAPGFAKTPALLEPNSSLTSVVLQRQK